MTDSLGSVTTRVIDLIVTNLCYDDTICVRLFTQAAI